MQTNFLLILSCFETRLVDSLEKLQRVFSGIPAELTRYAEAVDYVTKCENSIHGMASTHGESKFVQQLKKYSLVKKKELIELEKNVTLCLFQLFHA